LAKGSDTQAAAAALLRLPLALPQLQQHLNTLQAGLGEVVYHLLQPGKLCTPVMIQALAAACGGAGAAAAAAAAAAVDSGQLCCQALVQLHSLPDLPHPACLPFTSTRRLLLTLAAVLQAESGQGGLAMQGLMQQLCCAAALPPTPALCSIWAAHGAGLQQQQQLSSRAAQAMAAVPAAAGAVPREEQQRQQQQEAVAAALELAIQGSGSSSQTKALLEAAASCAAGEQGMGAAAACQLLQREALVPGLLRLLGDPGCCGPVLQLLLRALGGAGGAADDGARALLVQQVLLHFQGPPPGAFQGDCSRLMLDSAVASGISDSLLQLLQQLAQPLAAGPAQLRGQQLGLLQLGLSACVAATLAAPGEASASRAKVQQVLVALVAAAVAHGAHGLELVLGSLGTFAGAAEAAEGASLDRLSWCAPLVAFVRQLLQRHGSSAEPGGTGRAGPAPAPGSPKQGAAAAAAAAGEGPLGQGCCLEAPERLPQPSVEGGPGEGAGAGGEWMAPSLPRLWLVAGGWWMAPGHMVVMPGTLPAAPQACQGGCRCACTWHSS
jgi:hypothetical protein